jgi:membrane-associated protease RseP (regulator of RpoE activity)
MLPEQSHLASDTVDIPKTTPGPRQPSEGLQAAVAEVLQIERVNNPTMPQAPVQFIGHLKLPSNEAFDYLEPKLIRLEAHAYFSQDDSTGLHIITVFPGRFNPKPRPWWPNAILFALTVLSLFFVGASTQAGLDDRQIESLSDIRLWEGWPYALSLILILGAHELGHYFAARRHHVSVTLPYFIPMPFGLFGTLGAFIQLREPMRNRRVLFDVGVAGPLAGLVFAIPILIIGLATSEIQTVPKDEDTAREGNSLLYAGAKILIFGRFVPDGDEDVFINQLAMAGWTGLFVTALNLIPLGQLDGGHIIYTLLGRRVKRLFWPIIAVFATLAVWVSDAWFLWTFLLFFLGRFYATPLDDITPLDTRRRLVGYMALIIFILVFVPNPIQFIQAGS